MRWATAGVLLLAVIAPLSARGAFCSDAVIMSRTGVGDQGTSVNANAAACGQDTYDTRLIQPGANEVALRYAPVPQPGPDAPPLCGVFQGLGLHQVKMLLRPTEVLAGIVVYQGDWQSIAVPVTGKITGTVLANQCPTGNEAVTPGQIASTIYHTIDS